jgi:hypothetical protein
MALFGLIGLAIGGVLGLMGIATDIAAFVRAADPEQISVRRCSGGGSGFRPQPGSRAGRTPEAMPRSYHVHMCVAPRTSAWP